VLVVLRQRPGTSPCGQLLEVGDVRHDQNRYAPIPRVQRVGAVGELSVGKAADGVDETGLEPRALHLTTSSVGTIGGELPVRVTVRLVVGPAVGVPFDDDRAIERRNLAADDAENPLSLRRQHRARIVEERPVARADQLPGVASRMRALGLAPSLRWRRRTSESPAKSHQKLSISSV
jgi:hypothetical protein